MSLPNSINIRDDNFFVLENFALDPDQLYLYQLNESDGLSEKSFTINVAAEH